MKPETPETTPVDTPKMQHVSTPMKAILVSIGFVAVLVLGMAIGQHHARRSAFGFMEHRAMYDTFSDTDSDQTNPRGGMMHRGMGRNGVHNGVVGGVSSINGNTLTLRSNDTTHDIAISSTTSFYKAGSIAKQSDLQVGDIVFVTGTPDSNGIIQATSVTIR